jgi:hypothetical protein
MTGERSYPYPNVRATVRRTRHAPATPPLEAWIVIWLSGRRFRVRDESGRPYSEIVGDVTSERGFGALPRTMEGFMDTWDAPSRQGTELYGDRETGEAVIREAGGEPWPTDVERIEPVAEQLLTGGQEKALEPFGETTYLGRPCQEYRFAIEGDENGIPYRSDVRWLVWGPYVLLREVRDSRHRNLYALTETVDLDEGVVTELDVRP